MATTKKTEEEKIVEDAAQLIARMRKLKPGDRTELDRHYAICITQFEIATALYKGFVVSEKVINV